MKNFFFVVILTVLFVTSISAQDLHFGVQLSPSWSWMRTDVSRINGTGTALGMKLSAIVENRFSQAYAFTSGIGFHFNTGGKLRIDVPSNYWVDSKNEFSPVPAFRRDSASFPKETLFRYSLTYVEIPVGLKMRTPETGNHFRYFVEPGLTFGFRSNALGSITGAGNLDQEKINIKKDVGILNLSWGIGGGAEYIISNNTALVLGLYYQNGFADITKDNGTLFDADAKSNAKAERSKGKINSLTVRLGVMF